MGQGADDLDMIWASKCYEVVTSTKKEKTNMAFKYITGPVKWAKVFPDNKDDGEYAPEGGQYTIDIGVDKDTRDMILGWNRMYKPKEDEEYPDLYFFKFKRKHEHRKQDGELIEAWSGPPGVFDEDGEPWDGTLIGNGSTCTIKLDVSVTKPKGKKAAMTFVRLEAVRVDELQEFTPGDSDGGDVVTPQERPF